MELQPFNSIIILLKENLMILENAKQKSDGSTLIISNGGGWRQSNKIEDLIKYLKQYTLSILFFQYNLFQLTPWYPTGCKDDLRSEYFSNNFSEWLGKPHIWGNFEDYTHSFSIVIKDFKLLYEIQELVNKNITSNKFIRLAHKKYSNYWIGESDGFKTLFDPSEVEYLQGKRNTINSSSFYLKDGKLIKPWDLSIFDEFYYS